MYQQPRIIILKEGTDTSQGRGQIISNINAVEAITQLVKTTLGPCGRDKLINTGSGVVISNDGATIVKTLDIVHPAAKTLVDIAKSQDDEVGDGTTSVCLLAGEFLKNVKTIIEDGVHPQIIIRGFRLATKHCMEKIRSLQIEIDRKDPAKLRDLLLRCAGTAMNSKLIAGQKEFFAPMVVDAVMHLDDDLNIDMCGIKKVPGGSITDSYLVDGVAFKKTFSYAGFEQQPKSFENPKIVLLNVELELKNEKQNAEVRISDPKQYQSIVDAEWKIIYDKLEKIVQSGAVIVLSKLPIGDLATQYFADRNIFCAGRVLDEDMRRVAMATGGVVQTSLNDLSDNVLGKCAKFEEKQIGGDRYNLFTGCVKAKSTTIILRGGSEQFLAESERSLHDSIMIVKRALTHTQIVGGGGAIEMELSKHLKEVAKGIQSKIQLIVNAFASSLETIPRCLSENAGFDATDMLDELRTAHAHGNTWAGVDIENEAVTDTVKAFVWEPALVKINAISAASEAACLILSIDETVKSAQTQQAPDNRPTRGMPGAGRGMARR